MQWLKRAVGILPGSPFFHLRFLLSLPHSEQLAALEWLASSLGQIQKQGLIHPQQFDRFNTMLDLLGADRDLRSHLIQRVHLDITLTCRFSRFDALIALLVYLAHPPRILHPGTHRFLLTQCHAQRYAARRLLHWYRRFDIDYQDYASACMQIGADMLSSETRLRTALRKARSQAHPDHQGSEAHFHQLEQIKQILAL